MEKTRIAVPSTHPGGMDSELGQHFGHCDLYTIVDVENGHITQVGTLPNVPHVQGGCMAPVNHLAGNQVQVLIAGGMGMRPLMGFSQVGIDVFFGGNSGKVSDAVSAFLQGRLTRFSAENTCGGGQI
ncbi:NifB/NifX family molybdenum-iron cluster-binding protein [Desulfonatronovibrio hydrogenovorans]|uniref:NifB/NifX family molybdenum-iron cluster-binding protein n=1 Tax=Desulfonatronovibrio hydrogenovorans TaxID=53245 RepID=UPI000491E639|nr:NifB/NifX family molybdenum-iron cluster-binding protein [Desulfonatronovibrio hydrogenovorans]